MLSLAVDAGRLFRRMCAEADNYSLRGKPAETFKLLVTCTVFRQVIHSGDTSQPVT